ncbi:MAG: M48 family metallopeptidase [Clostridium sp.]|nr:M48 family metallopeptidase [Clostridium sp.]
MGVTHTTIEDVTDGKHSIRYTLSRSRRKTVGIKLNEKGEVSVSAPMALSGNRIKEIIIKKIPWILKKQEELKAKYLEASEQKRYIDGETFLYLGKEYTLKIQRGSASDNVDLFENDIVVSTADSGLKEGNTAETEQDLKIRGLLKSFYINRFLELVKTRMDIYAPKIGVSPGKVSIRDQKTRWGSCSCKGNISLNWKLIMAPLEVVDYVIIHELCHMKEMNHSKKFWNIVRGLCPNFKESQKWLKDNGHRLKI